MKTEEILAALAAGIVAGIVLSFIQRQFPNSGVSRL